MDPYEVLHIQENASLEEIRKAYIRLSLYYHPDRNTHLSSDKRNEYSDEFKKISNAYQLLSDLKKKEKDEPYISKLDDSNDFYFSYFNKILKLYNLENKSLYEILENIELDKAIRNIINSLYAQPHKNDTNIHENYTISITLDEYLYHQYKKFTLPDINRQIVIDLSCTEQEIMLNDNSKIYIILKDIEHPIYKRINGYDLIHTIHINFDYLKTGFHYELIKLDGTKLYLKFITPYKFHNLYYIKNNGMYDYTNKEYGGLYLFLKIKDDGNNENVHSLFPQHTSKNKYIQPEPLDIIHMLFQK